MQKQSSTKPFSVVLSLVVPLVFVVVAVLGVICIGAEERGQWYIAQGTFGAILFLLLSTTLAVFEWWRGNRRSNAPPISREFETYSEALRFLLHFIAVGIIAVLFNAIRYEHWVHGLVGRATSVGILLAGAAFIFGGLLGFLFGFPPNPPPNQASASPSNPQSSSGNRGAAPLGPSAFYTNTNLQEISDWLTKVIVGASLVELSKLPPLLAKLSSFVATGVNPYEPSPSVALALLGYFWSCGILYGYIWTKYEVAATSHRFDDDSAALSAVDDWLHRPPDPKDDPRSVMIAIMAASTGCRIRILLDAEKQRAASSEEANERVLPVFQALVEADHQEVFHRNRGQYAFALMGREKDPNDPRASQDDWTTARDQLSDAIRIRDFLREPDWLEYEFARAVCNIHLEIEFNQKQELGSIERDLDRSKAAVSPERQKVLDKDDAIHKDGSKYSAVKAWHMLKQAD